MTFHSTYHNAAAAGDGGFPTRPLPSNWAICLCRLIFLFAFLLFGLLQQRKVSIGWQILLVHRSVPGSSSSVRIARFINIPVE